MNQTKARPQTAGRIPNHRTQDEPRVLDLTAHRLRKQYVRTADDLPGGRKSLGRGQWRARNAQKGAHTPALSSLRALTADAANVAAELVASGCRDEAQLVALALEPLLPVLLEMDSRNPLPSVWALHSAETETQGRADVAMCQYATTGTAEDREKAMAAVLAHAVAALRLHRSLHRDGARVALGQPERASQMSAGFRALIHDLRGDGPRSA